MRSETVIMNTQPTKRIEWIDLAKGIGMILVLYGHLSGSGDNPWFPDLGGGYMGDILIPHAVVLLAERLHI